MTKTNTAIRRRGERSPSYPSIPLDAAVRRVSILLRGEGTAALSVSAVLDRWGYSQNSGGGLATLAALISFGLLQSDGRGPRRRVAPTPLAVDLVAHPVDSLEFKTRLQQAALMPQAHSDLWIRFEGQLPSEISLREALLDMGFSGNGASQLAKEYRQTYLHAGLGELPKPGPGRDLVAQPTLQPARYGGSAHKSFRLPLQAAWPLGSNSKWVNEARIQSDWFESNFQDRVVSLPVPGVKRWPTLFLPDFIDEEAWDYMIALLQAMKPGIVQRTDAVFDDEGAPDEDE